MNAWDSLPNGKHINTLLEFVHTHPNAAWAASWDAAWDAAWGAAWAAARDAARDAARGVARDAARDAAWGAAKSAVRSAAWGAVRGAARAAAWVAAWGATVALAAWDYAGDLFTADLSVVELAAHGGDNAAILLLPIKRVMEKRHEPT